MSEKQKLKIDNRNNENLESLKSDSKKKTQAKTEIFKGYNSIYNKIYNENEIKFFFFKNRKFS